MSDELLTRRELQVVALVVDRGSAKAAAVELGLSPRTVESHLARARGRAQVETTSQLVETLIRRGEL